MRIHILIFVPAALMLAVGQSNVLAQRSVGGGSSGGSSSFRSGGSFSGSGFGASSFGQASLLESPSQVSRESRQPGQFVGADADQARRFVGSTQAGEGVQRSSSGARGSGRGGGRGSSGNRSGGSQREEIRMSVSIGFNLASQRNVAARRADTSLKLAQRMENSSWLQTRSPMEVRIDSEGTATLIGSVATEHDRAIAQRLAMLESGIWRVVNELTVTPLEETPAAPQAPLPPAASPSTSGS